jgi:hypothetical protein
MVLRKIFGTRQQGNREDYITISFTISTAHQIFG